ncbi:MAG: ATP phosphoribosyltransferase regulatory subunit [Clostridia bacterium]|nr:ATP phosphoribosyltransferase regulatory subunit [Clostridia bacterium]
MDNKMQYLTKGEQVNMKLRLLYEQFGYKKYRMNKFEEYSFYINNKNFLESDRIITFTDLDGKLIALKPDVTLSIAKNTKATATQNERLYYNENVFRVSGMEFKELNQTGVEFIGHIDLYNTLEVVNLALSSLAIIDDNYILSISHMGFISSIFDEMNLSYSAKRKIADCLKQKRAHDIDSIASKYGISEENVSRLKNLVAISGELSSSIAKAEEIAVTDAEKDAVSELKAISKCFENTNFANKIRLDFSTVSNTDYYNGIMFEGYIEGVARSVITGGRYDYLIQKMGKSDLEAMGFAVNFYTLDRFFKPADKNEKPVLVLFDDNTDNIALFCKVKRLEASGKKVLVEKDKPENIDYDEIIDMKGGF